MRRIGLSSLALLCVSHAYGADLPPAVNYRAPAQVVAERFNWTGVYVGANAGYGWGTLSNTAGTASSHLNGALAGGQIGGNWQSGALVLGIEADFQATWQKRSLTFLGVTATEEMPWFGTLRGRAGVALDRHLLYVTGGASYADLKLSLSSGGVTLSSHDSKAGWVVGGGWEFMFAERWSAKLEGLYFDTGNTSATLFGVTLSGRAHDVIARAGVNYHF
jgi:outer membrane immunogenic protein